MLKLSDLKKVVLNYFPTFYVGLLMIFVVATSLSFLINNSIRLDESQSLWQTSRSLGKVFEIIAQDVHIPFYHTLLHIWQAFFGNDIILARILSLILFVLTIPAVYLLSQFAYKKYSISLFATLLVAISPFLNWYASEVRMYSLLTLLVVLNQYFFLRIFKLNDRTAFMGFALTALLGIYTHYFFAVYLLLTAAFFFLQKQNFKKGTFKKILITLLGVGILFLPWLTFVFTQGSASNTKPLLVIPTSVDLFNTISQFILGFQNDSINTLIVSLWPLVVILLFLLLNRRSKDHSLETQYFIMVAFVPLIMIFGFSLIVKPFFVSRYLAFSIPSLYILFSYLLSLYGKRTQILFRVLLVILMFIGFGTQVRSEDSPVVENYREAVEYINSKIGYRDVLIVSAPFTVYPIEYYYSGSSPINTLPIWDRSQFGQIPPFDKENLPDEVNTLIKNKSKVWLLLSYDQGYEEDVRLHFDKNFEKIEGKKFSKDLTLNVYQVSYN